MHFLDNDRGRKANDVLLSTSREIIVKSALVEGLIEDDDLAFIPETLPLLADLAGVSRDDFYKNSPPTGFQFPMLQRFFCYNFAKGVESAYLWDKNPPGEISFSYDVNDAMNGLVAAQVSDKFQTYINLGIMRMENVFCDFQNDYIVNPKNRFANSGRYLADAVACGLFWASQIGIDYGLAHLGLK